MAVSFPFTGILYRDWRRLRSMTSAIAPKSQRRARSILIRSLLNEAMFFQDQRQFGERLQKQVVAPPILVLGLARSGTTFLHQILCKDPRLAFPTFAQANNPHTFLTREGHTTGLGAKALRAANMMLSFWEFGGPRKSMERGIDRVLVGPTTPDEDEFALLNSGQSKLLAFCFPRDFDRLSQIEQRESWQNAWRLFLRKLSVIHPTRQLALKSPWHMARLPWILELFPGAKFVFISRKPTEIFRSTVATYGILFRYWSLQDLDWGDNELTQRVESVAISLGQEQILGYLNHRHLICPGHLYELRYEDLVRNPVAELERLYNSLSLPGFDGFLPHLRGALAERESYQTNVHPDLSVRQEERLRQEWEPYFDAFGYA